MFYILIMIALISYPFLYSMHGIQYALDAPKGMTDSQERGTKLIENLPIMEENCTFKDIFTQTACENTLISLNNEKVLPDYDALPFFQKYIFADPKPHAAIPQMTCKSMSMEELAQPYEFEKSLMYRMNDTLLSFMKKERIRNEKIKKKREKSSESIHALYLEIGDTIKSATQNDLNDFRLSLYGLYFNAQRNREVILSSNYEFFVQECWTMIIDKEIDILDKEIKNNPHTTIKELKVFKDNLEGLVYELWEETGVSYTTSLTKHLETLLNQSKKKRN